MRATRRRVFLIATASTILFAAQPGRSAELTGAWRGTVTVDGEQVELTLDFSDNDYFLYTYTNSSGFVRTVELSGPGQIQYVPPGGGVLTLAVESVVKRPGGIAYVLHTGFERVGSGYLDQQYMSEEADYALTPEGLRVRVVTRKAAYFGDRGGSVGGSQSAKIIEGVLKKVR